MAYYGDDNNNDVYNLATTIYVEMAMILSLEMLSALRLISATGPIPLTTFCGDFIMDAWAVTGTTGSSMLQTIATLAIFTETKTTTFLEGGSGSDTSKAAAVAMPSYGGGGSDQIYGGAATTIL